MPFVYQFVVGVPASQGSKRHVGGGRMIESSKKVGPWREAVAAQLVAAGAAKFGAAAVRLTVEFVLVRPGYLDKGKKPKPTPYHTAPPDLDKCVRSTCDALTIAGVWADDKNVCELVARKRYAEPGEATGAMIMIEALPEKEKPHGDREKTPRRGAGKSRRGRQHAPAPADDACPYFC